jgi:hypothetical protein
MPGRNIVKAVLNNATEYELAINHETANACLTLSSGLLAMTDEAIE